MPIHLILGSAGSGKAGRVIQRVKDDLSEHGSCFLVVPSNADRARFTRELAADPSGAVVGLEIGSFEQLITKIAGKLNRQRTDSIMELLLIQDVLRRHEGELERAAEWSGFANTARLMLKRVRSADLWHDYGRKVEEIDIPLSEINEWRGIGKRYEELLKKRSLIDDIEVERVALKNLKGNHINLGAVVVYGFEALSPARRSLIELIAQGADVAVALPWRAGYRVHERVSDLRDHWVKAGASLEELPGVESDDTLSWIANELFEELPKPRPTATNSDDHASIQFVDCCGLVQECEEIVRELISLRKNGLEWHDMAVAAADIKTISAPLLSACERAKIPARLQSGRSAIDVPVGRDLYLLFNALANQDFRMLVDALRSRLFSVKESRLAYLDLLARQHKSADLFSDEDVLKILPPRLKALIVAERGTFFENANLLLQSLRVHDSGEIDVVVGIAASFAGVAAALGNDQHVGLRHLKDAIAALSFPVQDRSDSGAVVISSIQNLRSVSFSGVILCGLHQDAFKPQVDDESEVPTATRDLLYLAVTRARKELRILRQEFNEKGDELAASPAWLELRNKLPDSPLRKRSLAQILPPLNEVEIKADAPPALALGLAAGGKLGTISTELSQKLKNAEYEPRARIVDQEIINKLNSLEHLAATDIERYHTCSARWFIERYLDPLSPDDDSSSVTQGVIIHAVLEQISKQIKDRPAHDQLREIIDQITIEQVAKYDIENRLEEHNISRMKQDILNTVLAEADWSIPDRISTEVSIGNYLPDALVGGLNISGVEVGGRIDRIDHYGAEVVLHDYKSGSFEISGSKLITNSHLQLLIYWLALSRSEKGVIPVAAIYRPVKKSGIPQGARSERLKEFGIIPANSKPLKEEQIEDLLSETYKVVEQTIHSIKKGVIHPLDSAKKCPSYCALQPICRIGEGEFDER